MVKPLLTHTARMRALRALRRAEKHYYRLGYDPVETITLVYRRALEFYDATFPNDEALFRDMLLKRQEKSARVAVELLKREQRAQSSQG